MVLLLLKVFGVRRVAGWALWLVRVIVSLAFLVAVGVMLYWWPETRPRILALTATTLVIAGIQALWLRRRKSPVPEAPQGERTIDGKVVPDMLAASALAVPQHSPDGEYVLRALPDYGKGLLKLDSADFEYVPELPGYEPKLLLMPVAPPAPQGPPLAVLRWVGAGAVVVCLVVAGLVIQSMRSDARQNPTMQGASVAAAENEQERPPLEAKGALSEPPATLVTTPAPATPASLRSIPSLTPAAESRPSRAPAPAADLAESNPRTRDTAPPATSTELATARETAPAYSPAAEPSAAKLPAQPRALSTPASMNLCIEFQGNRSCNLLRREGTILVGKWPTGDISHMEIEHFNTTDIVLNDSDLIAVNQQTVHMVYKAAVQGNQMTHGTIFFANNPIGTWTADWVQ